MKNNFQVHAIDASKHAKLFDYDEQKLKAIGAVRSQVQSKPGTPCRVSLQDADIGEEVILFPFKHHDVDSPYQATGPIFIRKNAVTAKLPINEVPKMLLHRTLSLRCYNESAMMIDARTIHGESLANELDDALDNSAVKYIHVHNAGPGCYNCAIHRA